MAKKTITSKIRPGTPTRVPTKIEATVLKLLDARSEQYGLQLVRNSKGKLDERAIYMVLNRMMAHKLISKVKRTQPLGPVYSLTPMGIRTLRLWEMLNPPRQSRSKPN